MTVAPQSADLNPHGIVSHARYAQERDMRAKTFNALRLEYPGLFPKSIRRGNKFYATRAEFDAFLDALRGTVSPGIAARAGHSEAA